MEGNLATGTHVIPKYLDLKESLLEKRKRALDTDLLYPMYHAMLKKVNRYLDEAMRCKNLVLATMMIPCFRLNLFQLVFGSDSLEVNESRQLLLKECCRTKDQQNKTQ
jgi:hypothetical protein